MHEMQTAATKVSCGVVYLSVRHAAGLAKTAELIEVLFGVEALGYQRHVVLNGGPHACGEGESGKN